MTDRRVDLALSTGSNDGTSWANAYQGKAGYATGVAASAAGDTLFVRDTESAAANMLLAGPTTLASAINPIRVIGVRTDAADTVLKTDVILGFREGDAAKAYTQTGAEVPPNAISTAGGDVDITGNGYYYAQIFTSANHIDLNVVDALSVLKFEECEFDIGGNPGDAIRMGVTNDPRTVYQTYINSLFTVGASSVELSGGLNADFFNCEFTSTRVGTFLGQKFTGLVRFFDCDFTACDIRLVDIAGFRGGRVEFHNCRMPSGHILTTGTAVEFYTVINYGSEDTTGLASSASEQALEIHTHIGVVDLEQAVVRTTGATDLATGLFAYAAAALNVTDNFVGVEIPLADIWVEGDGTAKTYTAFIANSLAELAANLFEDDEVYLRLSSPSGAGISMYDYLPDKDAPGDGGGQTQLLGTPVDLATDGSTWGASLAYDAQTANFTVGAVLTGGSSGASATILADTDDGTTGTLILGPITSGPFTDGETITDDNGSPGSADADGIDTTGNNKQKLSQSISPDYEGPVHGTLIFSQSSSVTLYADTQPVVT